MDLFTTHDVSFHSEQNCLMFEIFVNAITGGPGSLNPGRIHRMQKPSQNQQVHRLRPHLLASFVDPAKDQNSLSCQDLTDMINSVL